MNLRLLLAIALCLLLAFAAGGAPFLPAVLIDLLWAPLLIWAARRPAAPVRVVRIASGAKVCRAPPF